MATAAYVERLLTGRDHIEQGVRSCLGILRLATRYPGRTTGGRLRAGAGRRRQFVRLRRAPAQERPATRRSRAAEDGIGHHGNIRGPDYYH